MDNFISTLIKTSQDIIAQVTGYELIEKDISTEKELKVKDYVSVISGVYSGNKSFQIIISFSKELAKNISSIAMGGRPVALLDYESKYIILEISKMIIGNSAIDFNIETKEKFVYSPCIAEGDDITYNADGLITMVKFNLLNETMIIAILPLKDVEDIKKVKNIKKIPSTNIN